MLAGERGCLLRGPVPVREVERQEAGRLGVFEGAGSVGRHAERDIEPPGGLDKRRRPVGGGRKEQQQPAQLYFLAAAK